eukprot:Sspe_Gene.1937::Locus_647_Transcript_1_1_Confidence_1.000_Length_609::g.1937::m.1937
MPTLESLNFEEAEEETTCFPQLTWKERVYGFALCCALGLLLSVLSWITIATGKYRKYSVLMSLGNTVSLLSSGFLVGFKRQASTMFTENRRVASIVYLLTLVGTVVAAFVFRSPALAILLCIVQYAAFVWYCLSYIPYGRDVVLGCLKRVF